MGADQTSDDNDTPEAREILAIERTDYFKIGLTLTATILLLAATYAFVEWDALYKMKPNEFGDFLAGIFGPLVLLWVVMGFLQQGAELKYSREALLLQARELKASVEAQKNMGEAAWASVHVERDNQKAAENARIRGQQPILILQMHDTSLGDTWFETKLKLSNIGKDCVGVSLSFGDPSIFMQPGFLDQLKSGDSEFVELIVRREQRPSDAELDVTYRDPEGRIERRSFSLAAYGTYFTIEDEFGH
jgi:hypothetical protein